MTIPLTVLMPVKNGMRFLVNARKNIEANIASRDEIIVVNDGSTDETLDFLKIWSKQDSRLQVINNSGHGLVSALNFGIANASNKWIARFDVDDEYPKNRLMSQRAHIDDSVVAIFSDYEFFHRKNPYLGTIPSPVLSSPTILSLVNSERTAHPVVIFNRDAVKAIGMYRKDDFPAEDLSLWLRLSRIGNLITIPETLLFYRLGDSISTRLHLEMKNKTINLLESIGIPARTKLEVLSNYEDIFLKYDAMPLSTERKLLLVRDLIKITQKDSDSKIIRQYLSKLAGILFSKSDTIQVTSKMAYYRWLRNKYRGVEKLINP